MRQPLAQGQSGIDAGVSTEDFRAAMSALPSGVSIITAIDDHGPRGFTCTSLCSVSLEPPLLLICAHHASHTLAAIRRGGSFAVNLLHAGGRAAAGVFASNLPDKFATVCWRPGPALGLPWLVGDSAAYLECSVVQDRTAGDHAILVGLVISTAGTGSREPLIYHHRSYSGPAAGPYLPGGTR